jgi:hypothetical protein
MKEIIHPDFFDLKPIEDQFNGYNACYFCAGVSSVGMKEEKYFRLTYTMTMGFAEVFSRLNPGATFCYVSGAGTDSSEKGRMMWARVKGKTENDLQNLKLDVYNFRPAFMISRKEAKNPPKLYRYTGGLFKLMEKLMPNYVSGLDLVGKAMINVSLRPGNLKTLEVKDIRKIAESV